MNRLVLALMFLIGGFFVFSTVLWAWTGTILWAPVTYVGSEFPARTVVLVLLHIVGIALFLMALDKLERSR